MIVSKPSKMVYLIDTQNGNTQIVISNPRSAFYSDEWLETTRDNLPWFGESVYGDKIVVMTYAKFGVLAEKYQSFGYDFELILCDEIHSLPKFRSFMNKNGGANPHIPSQKRLEEIVNSGKNMVIGLSATPDKALKYINCRFNHISVDSDVRQLETQETTLYTNKLRLLDILSPDEKGIVYIPRITGMLEYQKEAIKKGFRTICIWSENNTDYPMTPQQKKVRNHILATQTLPSDYDMVIINASSETGINIYGTVDYIVIHSKEKDTQTQIRGRYREDLKHLYIWDTSSIHVPDEYLNRKLFADDKDKLCREINLHDSNGRLCKWTTIKSKITEMGYTIVEGRENSKRYAIITQ